MKLLLLIFNLLVLILPNNRSFLVKSSEFDKILIVNETCPQFVTMDIEKRGLGDQLSKLFGLLAIAYNSKVSIAVDDIFGTAAEHEIAGHLKLFDHLGLPNFPKITEMKSKYNFINNFNYEFDDLLFQQDIFHDLPCSSLVTISNFIYCSAGKTWVAWCFSTVGSLIQSIIRPLLDETADNRYRMTYNKIEISNYMNWTVPSHLPLKDNLTNVVWHVRVGDICLHCDEINTFQNIFNFLNRHFESTKIPYQNIVVHLEEKKVNSLFHNIPNVIHYTDFNTTNAIDLFLNADILISSGSSFVNNVAMMSKLHRPLVIQMIAKEAVVSFIHTNIYIIY
jgi:hypothetical protein